MTAITCRLSMVPILSNNSCFKNFKPTSACNKIKTATLCLSNQALNWQ